MKRITITVPETDLETWLQLKGDLKMSSFIRTAVNEYIKTMEPGTSSTIFDLILEQKRDFKEIQNKLDRLGRIETDLIDVTAALARFDMIDFDRVKNEWTVKK